MISKNVYAPPNRLPKVVKAIMLEGERILFHLHQTRAKHPITPDTIYITNFRVIRYSPKLLGLKHETEDYYYKDIANVKIDKGLIYSSILLKVRFLSHDLIFEDISTRDAEEMFRIIGEIIKQEIK
ncbi:MAG: PH domain-containing protein [Methanocellales archaeon]